jgi:hypothetical protein
LRPHQRKCKEEGRSGERQIDVGSTKGGRLRKGSDKYNIKEAKKYKIKGENK